MASKPLVGVIALLVAVAALGAAWRWTPLAEVLDLDTLTAWAQRLRALPFSPVLVVVAYVLAGLLVIPVTVLIAATGVVFGPVLGGAYAWLGAVVSAAVLYAIGRAVGREKLARYGGRRINRVSERLARRGLAAVALIRLLPVAPFTIVNLAAGASRIGARDFVLGTALGMAPGIVATVVIADGVAGGFDVRSIAIVAGGLVLLAVAGWGARRMAVRDEERRA